MPPPLPMPLPPPPSPLVGRVRGCAGLARPGIEEVLVVVSARTGGLRVLERGRWMEAESVAGEIFVSLCSYGVKSPPDVELLTFRAICFCGRGWLSLSRGVAFATAAVRRPAISLSLIHI